MIVIVPPDINILLGTILVIVGLETYRIGDWFDPTPKELTCIWYVPIVDVGVLAVIIVDVNDNIGNGDDPIVINKGLCAIS